jgi:hypothetical protein
MAMPALRRLSAVLQDAQQLLSVSYAPLDAAIANFAAA